MKSELFGAQPRWVALGSLALSLSAVACSTELGAEQGVTGVTGGAGGNTAAGTGTGGASAIGGTTGVAFAALTLATDVEDEVLPLSNATLAVSEDGSMVVATDADRDQVYLLSTATPLSLRTIELEAGDGPGRVTVAGGRAFVSSRRAPVVFAVDLASGDVSRFEVCSSPQGLAVDAAGVLQVACRDGTLLGVDAESGSVVRTLHLDDDLRDVVVRGDGLVVSRFRSAELLQLDAAGSLVARFRPQRVHGAVPGVAWRTIALADGRLVMAHQLMSTSTIAGFDAVVGSYSSFCGGISAATLSVIDPAAPEEEEPNPGDPMSRYTPWQATLLGVAGTLDVASPDGLTLHVTAPGNALGDGSSPRAPGAAENSASVWLKTLDPLFAGCGMAEPATDTGTVVAIAFLPDGRRVLQRRAPAELELEGVGAVGLAETPLYNAGFALFEMSVMSGISCTSCHPEGRDDGHVWAFSPLGFRRTPSLEGGVTQNAPFHWQGELPTLHSLVDEVMARRMGLGVSFSDEHVAQLGRFLDGVPAATGVYAVNADAKERGRVLFESEKTLCTLCHKDEHLTDNALHDVGTGGEFVTPSLVGVASRAPFMHDGCAPTLRDRFGVCGGTDHGLTDELTDAQIDDLVAYLESL